MIPMASDELDLYGRATHGRSRRTTLTDRAPRRFGRMTATRRWRHVGRLAATIAAAVVFLSTQPIRAEDETPTDVESMQRAYVKDLLQRQDAEQRADSLRRQRQWAQEQQIESGQDGSESTVSPEELARQRHAQQQLELEREQERADEVRQLREQEQKRNNEQKRYDANGNGWYF